MNKLILITVILLGAAGFGYFLYEKKDVFKKTSSNIATKDSNNKVNLTEGTPIVVMAGKTIITTESFQEEKEKIFKVNPELEQYKAFINIDSAILDALVNYAIMEKNITETGVTTTQDYKSDLESGYKEVERMVNTKYFTQKFSPSVTDAEVKEFYEENKDKLPEIIIAHGGIKAMELVFDQETEANNFAEKVKAANGNIISVAQELGITENKVKDLRLVHNQSIAVDPGVKDALLAMVQFPTVVVVKNADNKYAVVVGSGKEETRYRPYDQVKNNIKEYVKKQKQTEAIQKEIEELKKKYEVVIDTTALEITDKALDSETPMDVGDLNDLPEDLSQLNDSQAQLGAI